MSQEFENGRRVARFRPTGFARFFEAGFLVFWLCGWAIGETFALGALAAIGLSHLPGDCTGLPRPPFRTDVGFSIGAGLFLLVWVTFWTLGGIMAARETLRLLWSTDEIQWDIAGLILVRRLGPFRTRREVPVDQIVGFRELPHHALAVDMPRGSLELTRLGTRVQRRELRDELRAALPGRRPASSGSELPDGWHSTVDGSGTHVLAFSPDRLRLRAGFSWIVGGALVFAGFAILAAGIGADASAAETLLRLLGLIPILAGASLIAFFALGNSEVRVRNGSVSFVRRALGRQWSREMNVGLLRVLVERDSDGDRRYTLLVHGDGRRKTVASALHDPGELLILGRWLSARAGRPLELDREIAQLD